MGHTHQDRVGRSHQHRMPQGGILAEQTRYHMRQGVAKIARRIVGHQYGAVSPQGEAEHDATLLRC